MACLQSTCSRDAEPGSQNTLFQPAAAYPAHSSDSEAATPIMAKMTLEEESEPPPGAVGVVTVTLVELVTLVWTPEKVIAI